jgi:AraC-like DNA-binding protein
VGIVVAGFYKVIEHSYPVEVFTEPHDALNWLGASDQADVIAATDDLLDTISGTSGVVHAFRTHLSRNPGIAKLGTVSAALGLSRRSLQRKLHEANTSFQVEQNMTRITLAKRLLRETNQTIKQVAFDVGCSSGAAFSVLFRRVEGLSPSAWRSRYKRFNQSGL